MSFRRGRIGENGSPDRKACLNYVLPWASPELQGVYSALFSKRL